MVVVIRQKRHWLWRAVDNAVDDEGEVLDFLVHRKRDAKAAKKLMKKLLKKHGCWETKHTRNTCAIYTIAVRICSA